jgi:hypothetical protein
VKASKINHGISTFVLKDYLIQRENIYKNKEKLSDMSILRKRRQKAIVVSKFAMRSVVIRNTIAHIRIIYYKA